jgi:hypothetical protein
MEQERMGAIQIGGRTEKTWTLNPQPSTLNAQRSTFNFQL